MTKHGNPYVVYKEKVIKLTVWLKKFCWFKERKTVIEYNPNLASKESAPGGLKSSRTYTIMLSTLMLSRHNKLDCINKLNKILIMGKVPDSNEIFNSKQWMPNKCV